MTIKLEKGDGILWITKVSHVVGEWYRMAKKTDSKIRFEDAPQNYLLNHLCQLRTERIKSFWVEDKLRHSSKEKHKRKFRTDVIVEYADQVWLIEVKGHNAVLTDVFDSEKCRKDKKCNNAVKQLMFYEQRIRELGWWGLDKNPEKLQKVVFWCHSTENESNKRVPIDLSVTSKWPVDR